MIKKKRKGVVGGPRGNGNVGQGWGMEGRERVSGRNVVDIGGLRMSLS